MNTKQKSLSSPKNRLIATLVAICLMLGIIPIMVLAEETEVTYADQQTTSAGAGFNIKFSKVDATATESPLKLYKVDTNKYRIDGDITADDILKLTYKFPNLHGGRNHSYMYAGIYADPTNLDTVATGDPIKREGVNLESDTLGAIDCSSLLSGKTYYFVIKKESKEGNQDFGADVVFEFKTKSNETKVEYTDEQRVSTDDGACFCIKFSYLDGSMTETQQNLYKVDTNKYRIDGELDTEGMFKATFKFPNKHGGRKYSYCYAGIYANPNDLTKVATGDRFVKENTGLEADTLIAIDPSSLLPGTTYYFVLESTSKEGNQPFGANVVFELKTKAAPAHTHTEEVIAAVAPTCTETGLTEGKKCSECGEILVAQETVPAKGHTPVVIAAVEATCTEPGLTEGKKCSECGDVLVAQETVPAKGHTEEVVKGKAATCTEKGLTDGKKCSVCNAVLEEQKEIPAKGHTEEVLPGKEATCTETGLTEGKKCSVCNAVLVIREDIPALGHDYKDGKCTRCGADDPDYKPEEPDTKFTGLANEADKDGNWWYYTDGKIDTNHTGVDQNKYGWWRVENGKVNFNAQGIYQNQYGWWKTTDGKVTFKENSIYQNEFGWWKCKDSKVDFTAQSIYQNKHGWWKTTDGKVTFKENGLFKNQYGTWKVENSKVNFNFNGKYQGKTIKNGKVV